jgi:Predicted integral membrane protein (DUF2269)
VDTFDVLVFFHIVGVVLIAGGAGVGIATGMTMPPTASVRAIGAMSKLAARAEHFATTPGAVITLITGTWFIVDDDGEVFQQFDIDETWLWLSYVVWVVAVLLGEGVLARFNHRLQRQAEALEAQGIETSDELRAAASSPTGLVTGTVLTLLLLLFLYLMVFQPGR